MINNVTLVGRLTKDPELRYTADGTAVANFTLAVNRPFSNAQGEREADFINCIVWRKPAENTANYLKKGSLAGVVGRIQTRSYDNNEGKRVFVTEVVAESVQFLEPRSGQGGNNGPGNTNTSQGQFNGSSSQNGANNAAKDPFANDGKPIDINDDDLPF